MILEGPEFKRDATQTALMGVFNIHVYYIDMNLYTLFHCQSKDKVGHSQEWKETERERGQDHSSFSGENSGIRQPQEG